MIAIYVGDIAGIALITAFLATVCIFIGIGTLRKIYDAWNAAKNRKQPTSKDDNG